jgi:hypothetical protein
MMKVNTTRFFLLISILVTLSLVASQPAALQTGVTAETDSYPNCRFGVGVQGNIASYDTPSLNLGWYVDWGIRQSPPTPGGIEYVQMVRLKQQGTDGWDFKTGQSWTALTNAINANPGATWLIGNEPDSPFQDDMVPGSYTRAYHDLYGFIKAQDPTAQVGIGGIVQPTPLRLAYLDTVWDTYYQVYSETMPVDLWNIHSFVLRETSVEPDPEPCGPDTVPVWGAYIPPGTVAQTGELYCIRDQDNLDIFWQRIRLFRQWMADKGERDKPLVITEYGVLFPEDYSDEDGRLFSQPRVGAYMTSTFDLMLNETDPKIGFPFDDNRLVQRWAWFSLSEADVMGGALFDPQTGELRLLGQYFQDYTSAISPTVDLLVARAYATPAVFWYEDAPVTATLKAVVSNVGNISATLPITVTFYDGPPGELGTNPIGAAMSVYGGLQGCADYGVVETQWSDLGPGAHRFYAVVTGGDDNSPTNNVAEGVVLVATQRVFLPLGFKGH